MAQGIAYNMEMMGKFRYFCQKVLPAVYDDSLSYYELLNKVVEYLNNTINVVNYNSETIKEMVDYLNQQNIEEMVAAMVAEIMEDMKESGELADIINETIFDELNEKIEYLFDQTINYRGWGGWDVTTNGDMFTASCVLEVDFDGTSWIQYSRNNDMYYHDAKFTVPIPYQELHLVVSSDESLLPTRINGYKKYGCDVRTFAFYDKNADYPGNGEYFIRMVMHGRRATLPETCPLAYSSASGDAIANIAKTYYNAMLNGREFAYGENFFYMNPNNIINDNNGKGRLECDTFVGLCLRGIAYEDSPYTILTPNFQYAYDDLYIDISGATAWTSGNSYLVDDIVTYGGDYYKCIVANSDVTFSSLNFQQIWTINTSGYFAIINQTLHPADDYLKRDIRFASDIGIMGMKQNTLYTDKTVISGEIVSLHQAKTGDIACWRRIGGKPISFGGSRQGPGYDNISHVGVLSIEGGDAYIYHVSDSAHTFGHIVDRIAIRDLSDANYAPPDYFVRARYVDPVE